MKRITLFIVFLVGTWLVFTARLFYIQVIDDRWKLSAENNVIRTLKIYAPRGEILDRNGKVIVANQVAYDLMVIPMQVQAMDTAEFCRLFAISKDFFVKQLEAARSYSRFKPSEFIRYIQAKDYAYLQEKLFLFPGFFFQKRTLRTYPYPAAANVLGYIGEVNEEIIERNPEYSRGDFIGVAGIEKSYEKYLKGKHGVRRILVDVRGREKGPYKGGIFDSLAIPGSDLVATIDIELQMYGEALMKNKRGSIVAIEPSTGEILMLVTSPSYDPNLLVGRDRNINYRKLYNDSINKPLYDRALLAEYPPGSPFKILQALVALQEGVIQPSTTFTCGGGFRAGSLFVRCKCGTNYPLPLLAGIYKSCNNYFCNTYKRIIDKYPNAPTGVEVWSRHMKSFGLGMYFDNDLPTGRKGLVPDSAYFNRSFRTNKWKTLNTISLGIGQGEMLVTPVQLANAAAAIANRGYYYTPHLIKKIDGKPITNPHYTKPKKTTVDSIHFPPVIEGMFQVFEQGTARASRIPGIELCGKTGTAQNPHGQDHSIFMAFGPKDDPKIAIAIFVENGYWGSRWAAPIASLIIEKYLTGKVERKDLEKRMMEGSLKDEYDRQLIKIFGQKLLTYQHQ
ncbi:penicillin-binding protein 2 [Thermaurantimonas aggregans]|uniref:Penicillin-binding protein 2 n=1 Tax=Thermaurantimonas aggregans TaxID=2173829 RepID=A0A401XN18_9FLAO|nr:penicillin-binding protein 2 [Thermaurantimonas aggregans]GCD78363.1 penicillin-binding protein 2 [Thermaurantimonas aggregans]